MSKMNGQTVQDRGAILALGAAALAALLLAAALVIDLGAVRVGRARAQTVTDDAATAAVVALVNGDGVAACESAFGYVEAHVGPLSGVSCAGFPAVCDTATTVSTSTTASRDGMVFTVTFPVDDNDPLMTPGSIGSNSQSLVGLDGERCERFGVRVDTEHNNLVGGMVGISTTTTTNHSVALVSDEYGRNLLVNLLLLEPRECDVLSLGGGGSSGGVSVGSVVDPDNGDVYPGRIALDSDGSICGSDGVINTNGSGASIVANGDPGCAEELPPTGSGFGCGLIETFAPGSPGCNMPACSAGGIIGPSPTQVTRPLTRAPVDWKYNCRPSYPAALEIGGCRDYTSTPPYIDNLIASANSPTETYRSYVGEGYDCHVKAPQVMPPGHWRVECPILRLQDPVTFSGGNVIFEGEVLAGADLQIDDGNVMFYSNVNVTNELRVNVNSNLDEVIVYMRDGVFSKSASSFIHLKNTLVYVSPTAQLDFGGGGTDWSAPIDGPFINLALWSDSAAEQHFSGGALLKLDGIFFTPYASIVYTGSGGQDAVEAQFISRRLRLQGNGSLHLQPKFNRALRYPPPNISELIR